MSDKLSPFKDQETTHLGLMTMPPRPVITAVGLMTYGADGVGAVHSVIYKKGEHIVNICRARAGDFTTLHKEFS